MLSKNAGASDSASIYEEARDVARACQDKCIRAITS